MIPLAAPLQEYFADTYREFKPLLETSEGLDLLNMMFDKIRCMYPEYEAVFKKDGDCKKKLPFFMLVAHYLVMGNYVTDLGLNAGNGLVSSSSIDSVSISYQTSPYDTQFTYFLGQTKYGQEYLAYLARQSGIRYFK